MGHLIWARDWRTCWTVIAIVAVFSSSGRLPSAIGAPSAAVPADQRFSVMWQVSGGVHHVAVRGDASIRDTDDPGVVVTKIGVGQYCIHAPNALEGAVGSLQNQGGSVGTIGGVPR